MNKNPGLKLLCHVHVHVGLLGPKPQMNDDILIMDDDKAKAINEWLINHS